MFKLKFQDFLTYLDTEGTPQISFILREEYDFAAELASGFITQQELKNTYELFKQRNALIASLDDPNNPARPAIIAAVRASKKSNLDDSYCIARAKGFLTSTLPNKAKKFYFVGLVADYNAHSELKKECQRIYEAFNKANGTNSLQFIPDNNLNACHVLPKRANESLFQSSELMLDKSFYYFAVALSLPSELNATIDRLLYSSSLLWFLPDQAKLANATDVVVLEVQKTRFLDRFLAAAEKLAKPVFYDTTNKTSFEGVALYSIWLTVHKKLLTENYEINEVLTQSNYFFRLNQDPYAQSLAIPFEWLYIEKQLTHNLDLFVLRSLLADLLKMLAELVKK